MIHVAVAVIQDHSGRVLLTRRAADVHQGGLWEFPGGKLEPDESLTEALCREINEELGIVVQQHQPLIRITHHYPDKSVLLDVHRVTAFSGYARGMEGQPLAWVAIDQLHRYPMPAADRPIINAIRLPDYYLITGQDPLDREGFLARFARALAGGIRLAQLRAPGLSEEDYRNLARKVKALCREYGARLILNAEPRLAIELEADGVHLNRHRLMGLQQRPLDTSYWVGASCHTEQELLQAARLELDYVVLSPVLPTRSHPGDPGIGWQRFADLCDSTPLPVYALGGLRRDDLQQAICAGARGIAAITGLWC